jgi:hypothetical protein
MTRARGKGKGRSADREQFRTEATATGHEVGTYLADALQQGHGLNMGAGAADRLPAV